MRFRVIAWGLGKDSRNVWQPYNKDGVVIDGFDDINKAKKAAEELLSGHHQACFSSGYDVFILDLDKGTVASRATKGVPILAWKDSV